MGSHNMLSKNDRALVAYLVHLGAGTKDDVYPGRRSQVKTLPNTVCWSEEGTADLNTGSYKGIGANVMVRYAATDKTDLQGSRVAAAFDAFWTIEDDSDWDSKKVAKQITDAARAKAAADALLDPVGPDVDLADYTCLEVRPKGVSSGFNEERDQWIETSKLEMDAAPSDVS